MTPLDYIAPPRVGAKGRRALTLDEAETNKALARQWKADNPEFFATDPATLRDPRPRNRPTSA